MVSPRLVLAKAALATFDLIPDRYRSLLVELLNKRYASPNSEDLVEISLRHAADPISVLNALAPATTQDNILHAINALVSSRHPSMDPLFAGVERIDDETVRSVAGLWRAEENGSVFDRERLEDLARRLADVRGRSRRRIDLLLLNAMIKAESLDLVDGHLAGSSSVKLADLPAPLKMGVLRCALKQGPEAYAARRSDLQGSLTPLDELRLIELDAAHAGTAPLDHDELLQRLTRLVPDTLRKELETVVVSRLGEFDTHWMNARIDKLVAEELLDHITEAIARKRPLSLVRLSDGEAYPYDARDETTREKHWWGVELEPDLRAAIKDGVREAAHEADLLGLPSAFRFLRDTGSFTTSFETSMSTRGLLAILREVKPKAGVRIVEERVHQVLFTAQNLKRLTSVPGARTVVVSSIKPSIAASLFPGATFLTVPTHHKTRTNVAFETGSMPLPYTYRTTVHEIRSTVHPGDVVMVAAGIIGKIFVREACRAGAVALDVGAMADYLMGSKTRSVGDVL